MRLGTSHFSRATWEIHKLVVIRFLQIVWNLGDHSCWELARTTWIIVKFIVEKYDDKSFLFDDVDGVDEQAVQGRVGGQGGQVALQVEQCESFQVQQGSWSGVEEGELNRLLCRELSNLFGGEQLKEMVEDGLNSRSVQG